MHLPSRFMSFSFSLSFFSLVAFFGTPALSLRAFHGGIRHNYNTPTVGTGIPHHLSCLFSFALSIVLPLLSLSRTSKEDELLWFASLPEHVVCSPDQLL